MKIYVMIPTYNEKENIKNLIEEILSLKINDLNIVVIDDFSPDRTWKIVQEISKKNKNVNLILRKKNKGRGLAGIRGYKFCLDKGADLIIEMDADFSHNPKYIPKLIDNIKGYDIVLGSRLIKGGKDENRSYLRRIFTILANFYVRVILGIKVIDCNSGFRCIKRKVLEEINIHQLTSKGPTIIQEVLFKSHLKGFKIKEIPIVFIDRHKGRSKLGIKQLAAGYFMVLKLKIQHIFGYL